MLGGDESLSLSIKQSNQVSTLFYAKVHAFPQTSDKTNTMMYGSEYKGHYSLLSPSSKTPKNTIFRFTENSTI